MTRVVLADRADDLIDTMISRSNGSVLRAPRDSKGGEYDAWRQGFSRRDVRRLVGAGLVAADGLPPDELLVQFDGCHEMNADEFCAWWMAEGLRGLDQRAARRARADVDERPESDYGDALEILDEQRAGDALALLAELVTCADVPAWFHAWCDRTVHEPKLLVLAELGAARWLRRPACVLPATAWAPKLALKFERRCTDV